MCTTFREVCKCNSAYHLHMVCTEAKARAARQVGSGAAGDSEGAHLATVALDGLGRLRPERQQGKE